MVCGKRSEKNEGESLTRPCDCRAVGGAADTRARQPAVIVPGEERRRGRLRTEHDRVDRQPAADVHGQREARCGREPGGAVVRAAVDAAPGATVEHAIHHLMNLASQPAAAPDASVGHTGDNLGVPEWGWQGRQRLRVCQQSYADSCQ